MADRAAQLWAGQDGLVPDAPGILKEAHLALRWAQALALRADSRAHREAKDSNLVWEAPAWMALLAALQQVSLCREPRKLHGAELHALAHVAASHLQEPA
jgi:hypothetical protein